MVLKRLKSILFIHGKLTSIIAVPLVVTFLSVVTTLLVYMLFQHVNVWQGMELGVAGTFEEFCELNRMNELFREPVNTLSNLAYLLYGSICIAFYKNDLLKKMRNNLLLEFPEFSLLMGFAFLYLAFGSFYYHASLTKVAQRHDMAATYSVAIFPVVINTLNLLINFGNKRNFLFRKQTAQAGFFMIILASILFYVFKWYLNSNIALPVIFVLIAVTAFLSINFIEGKSYVWFLLLGVLFMAIAFGLWYADRFNFWCNPVGIFQGHAIWHLLTGLAAFFVYLFLRSERKKFV